VDIDEVNNLASRIAILIALQSQDKVELYELASAFKLVGSTLTAIAYQQVQDLGYETTKEES
jgi:hypothetical protein